MSADSDEHLIRYILRDLPESEAERLDERSVTDEAFAQRLRELENDLVDRYAREGATDESLNRFEQRVRDSTYLRNKVQFARALQEVSHACRDRCCHGAASCRLEGDVGWRDSRRQRCSCSWRPGTLVCGRYRFVRISRGWRRNDQPSNARTSSCSVSSRAHGQRRNN